MLIIDNNRIQNHIYDKTSNINIHAAHITRFAVSVMTIYQEILRAYSIPRAATAPRVSDLVVHRMNKELRATATTRNTPRRSSRDIVISKIYV